MNLFSYLKERVSILEVVGQYVSLKKAGGYHKGRCPFHSEKDASFTVSPHKEIFYCFGCHATGDAIAFIAQIEGCNQLEAAQFIIDKYGIEVPPELLNDKHENTPSVDEKNRYFLLCQIIAQWCTEQLKLSTVARTYLDTRMVDQSVQERFGLGYFPAGLAAHKSLQKYLHQQQLLVKDLFDQHILIDNPKGVYSPFEDRIIFPITDHLGRHCGFGGRIFKTVDERAKYYNSRENDFFNKGAILFGIHQAKQAIQKSASAFLVEGYLDCLAMAQHGYTNTVATLGTACTSNHLKLLSHYADVLYVIFDGDKAGIQAMLRLTQLCWHANIDIRIICLPENEDPASLLGDGKKLDTHIAQAQDIFTFFITYSSMHFRQQPLKKKLIIVREILAILGDIDDRLKRMVLLQEAAERLQIPYETLQRACTSTYVTPAVEPLPIPETDRIPDGEQKLFALIINNPSLLERADVCIIRDVLTQPLARILIDYQQLSQKTLHNLVQTLSEDDKQLTHALVMAHDGLQPAECEQLIQQNIRQHWKSVTQTIKEKIAHAQQINDPAQVTRLLEQLQELKKKILTRSAS